VEPRLNSYNKQWRKWSFLSFIRCEVKKS
jgi:hypothetical protein